MTVAELREFLLQLPQDHVVCRAHYEVGSSTAWDEVLGAYVWDDGVVELTFEGDPIHG